MNPFENSTEHLRAELRLLDLRLQRHVLRLRAARLLTDNEFRGLYIPDEQIDALLNTPNLRAQEPSATDSETPTVQVLTACLAQTQAEVAERAEASQHAGVSLALPRLLERFGLSPMEADMLLIGVAPEIETKYETLYAYAQNDVTRKRPTIDLILKLLCDTPEEFLSYRALFADHAPLFRYRLLCFGDDPQERVPTFLSRFVKVEPRIVDFLLDSSALDARLLPFTQLHTGGEPMNRLSLPDDLRQQLHYSADNLPPLVLFQGPEGVGKRSTAQALCVEIPSVAGSGGGIIVCDLRAAVQHELPFDMLAALLFREIRLQQTPLYLDHFDTLLMEDETASMKRRHLLCEVMEAGETVFVGSEAHWQPEAAEPAAPYLLFTFDLPDTGMRQRLWDESLAAAPFPRDKSVDTSAVADAFLLTIEQIKAAARQAGQFPRTRPPKQRKVTQDDLFRAARVQSVQGLSRLAQKVETPYVWNDLVLSPRAQQHLRAVYASVRYRSIVHGRWGFDRKLALGKGLNILFAGPSGTGKTMAASILARELGFDLFKIDLANVVSKYIGDTEKNLSRIFEAARASNAMLFFDEADALFGKRSEVKDAHDRYANIEVAYLLQKMEEYEGVAILATNLKGNLDAAFARRVAHTIEFTMPRPEDRERIWRGIFPTEAPLAADVDLRFLAQRFDLAGGNIRNIALAAAFSAAEEGTPIQMRHLIVSTARELQKMDKQPAQADFREYYHFLR